MDNQIKIKYLVASGGGRKTGGDEYELDEHELAGVSMQHTYSSRQKEAIWYAPSCKAVLFSKEGQSFYSLTE